MLGILELIAKHLERQLEYGGFESLETITSIVEFVDTMVSQVGRLAIRDMIKARLDIGLA
jgi:hypothetical protein